MSHNNGNTTEFEAQDFEWNIDHTWLDEIPFDGRATPAGFGSDGCSASDPIAYVVREGVTGKLAHFEYDALCGLLLLRGVPALDCEYVAAYVVADRETLHLTAAVRRGWIQDGPGSRGVTWELFAPLAITLPIWAEVA